ncbi:MAG: pantetheine-phosphate adenylyltransferase [Bdellovibrionales bacterium]|nr:pantetheine-phosphate adenylyltransferase [Bdellovibrionales bacterium]
MNSDKKLCHGLYPGSFDPITYGHIDIVRRFAPFFNKLTVLTASSIHKTYWFSLEERTQMAREVLKDFSNVTVDSHTGLTVDYARQKGIVAIIRGLRSTSDFPYERDIAINNKKMYPALETFLVFSETGQEVISAKLIKEIATHGGNLADLVPAQVQQKIEDKLKNM